MLHRAELVAKERRKEKCTVPQANLPISILLTASAQPHIPPHQLPRIGLHLEVNGGLGRTDLGVGGLEEQGERQANRLVMAVDAGYIGAVSQPLRLKKVISAES